MKMQDQMDKYCKNMMLTVYHQWRIQSTVPSQFQNVFI